MRPCALVISTPLSVVTALTAAAKNGILVKDGLSSGEASLAGGDPDLSFILPFGLPGPTGRRSHLPGRRARHAGTVVPSAAPGGMRTPGARRAGISTDRVTTQLGRSRLRAPSTRWRELSFRGGVNR